MERIVIYFGLLLVLSGLAIAAPAIVAVSGNIDHGQPITVSGSGFGAKSPAAPLWWDDMEGAADGSKTFSSGELPWVISGTLAGASKHYSEVRPRSGESTDHYLSYRNAGWRGVAAPHSRSSKYATGGHYVYPNNNPTYDNAAHYQNVGLTVDSGAADKNIWYIHYYYRVDPLWYSDNPVQANHKKGTPNFGSTAYDTPNCYVSGDDEGETDNHDVVWTWNNRYFNSNIGCADSSCVSGHDGQGPNGYTELGGPNARLGWVGAEYRWDSPNGVREIWRWNGGPTSGKTLYETLTGPSAPACCRNIKDNTRSFSIGFYYHHCLPPYSDCGTNNDHEVGCNDCYRYFDDIYVDTTFSRIVLANNANYDSATIVEPQIPSAWSGGSITAKLNLGSLPASGTLYLFVFDADNNHNAQGYPMTLGGGSQAICGNGIREGAEQCDDGNTITESCQYGQTSCIVCSSACQNVSGTTSYCGNNGCDAQHENCSSCPSDCGACQCIPVHAADNNPCDRAISVAELMAYISIWREGSSVSLGSLMEAVRIWKNG